MSNRQPQFALVLSNDIGCEIDRATFTLPDDETDESETIADQLIKILRMQDWMLNIGDTIKIEDVI